MFEHFETASDVYGYRLGAALAMEHDWVETLSSLIESVPAGALTEHFERRADAAHQQIVNLNALFAPLELAPAEYPSPASKALMKSETSFVNKCADEYKVGAAIAAALTFEAHKVATYTVLLSTLPATVHPTVRTTVQQHLTHELAAYEQTQSLLAGLARTAQ